MAPPTPEEASPAAAPGTPQEQTYPAGPQSSPADTGSAATSPPTDTTTTPAGPATAPPAPTTTTLTAFDGYVDNCQVISPNTFLVIPDYLLGLQ